MCGHVVGLSPSEGGGAGKNPEFGRILPATFFLDQAILRGMSAPASLHPPPALPRLRAADPSPADAAAPSVPLQPSPPELLRRAQELGIPWERILLDEIKSEQTLRRYLADVEADFPLWSTLSVLSFSFLQSWRVRDRIQALACQARGASAREAVRQLRLVFQRLTGKAARDQASFAEHLWFAYQRVLLLQRVSRAAARSHGTTAERLASICSRTGCCFDDAAWAVCQEDLPRRGHRLDAAIRKTREEGFQVPRASSEANAFAELRNIVRTSPHLTRRQASPRRSQASSSVPQRLAHPVEAV